MEKAAPLLRGPFLTPFVLGHHSLWMKDVPLDRNARICYTFVPFFGALLSWPGVESVDSRVAICKVPYTFVRGGTGPIVRSSSLWLVVFISSFNFSLALGFYLCFFVFLV